MRVTPIVELGERIEQAWHRRHFDVRLFPEIASEHLRRAELHRRVSGDDIVEWVIDSPIPPQFDPKARFGQPPVTVYRGRRFVVDALFWVDGTTAIHDHGFSGAFQVLSGSSIEATFQFEPTADLEGHLQLGDLSVEKASLRRAGDVSSIVSGPTFIHSLFHLDRPSVSLVVRTFWDRKPGVQFRYYPAGLAHDEYFDDEVRDRQIQIVQMLRDTEHPQFERIVAGLVRSADANTVFEVIKTCARARDSRIVERLSDGILDRDFAARLGRWLLAERRNGLLRRARADVKDPSLRFMLAVLLNAQRRTDVLKLTSESLPGSDSPGQVARWIRQLSEITLRLQVGALPWEPNILGIPKFEDGFEEALVRTLKDEQGARTERERSFLDALRSLPPLSPLFS